MSMAYDQRYRRGGGWGGRGRGVILVLVITPAFILPVNLILTNTKGAYCYNYTREPITPGVKISPACVLNICYCNLYAPACMCEIVLN